MATRKRIVIGADPSELMRTTFAPVPRQVLAYFTGSARPSVDDASSGAITMREQSARAVEWRQRRIDAQLLVWAVPTFSARRARATDVRSTPLPWLQKEK